MSDCWIRLVPADPHLVPDPPRRGKASARLEIAPKAIIEANVCQSVTFFDCGENFQKVFCPSCGAEVRADWWTAQMDADYDNGFRLAVYSLPCCVARHTLDELVYDCPQAFGTFVLDAMNPDIGTLADEHKRELEEILGAELRVIYRHL